MIYELTIRQLEPYTAEEIEESKRRNGYPVGEPSPNEMFSDRPYHQIRVVKVVLDEAQYKAVQKSVLEVS